MAAPRYRNLPPDVGYVIPLERSIATSHSGAAGPSPLQPIRCVRAVGHCDREEQEDGMTLKSLVEVPVTSELLSHPNC